MATPTIPSLLLKQLYTFGSLENTRNGVVFSIKNRLTDTRVTHLKRLVVDGRDIPPEAITIRLSDDESYKMHTAPAFDLPLGQSVQFLARIARLPEGKHSIEIVFDADLFGELVINVEDSIAEDQDEFNRIPRDTTDDYSEEAIHQRQTFVESFTGQSLHHIKHYSFDPHTTQGNIEHFTGVVQIPLGFAGPLVVNGEHAQGEFLIPLATSEGSLVASYNRGIKVLNMCGGVKCTVVGDAMQRAPVFIFENAQQGRDFIRWVDDNIDKIREEAEATSSIARLQYIDPYLTNKFVYLRFNYSTGDAAGQNMVGRATFAACSWILDQYKGGIQHFYLESNFATDKKASQVNIMRTRGKRVTAEAILTRDALAQVMRVDPEDLYYQSKVATMGAFFSGANNNGAHSPNAITAMFIATGQDVANVSESSAGLLYTELTPERDIYVSMTIPSLIVATYGGGTGLATQRECLQLLDCYGHEKVNNLAEIVAGVVLAGEISLGSAIASSDWVSSHEQYGRNR